MSDEIKVAVRSKDVISITMLENLQGNLKTLSDQNYQKLKNEILTDGFSFVVHIYEDLASAKLYIIDGHQRIECLKRMKDEGYSVPQVPVAFVEADDLDHAKRKVLAAASQYGSFNQGGAEEFIKTIRNVDLDYLHKSISMPFVNFDMMTFPDVEKILVSTHLREKTDPNKEWTGMPEFNQDDKMPFRTILVHFDSQDAIDAFSDIIGQNITDKTKSIWHPEQIRMDTESKRYVLRKNEGDAQP